MFLKSTRLYAIFQDHKACDVRGTLDTIVKGHKQNKSQLNIRLLDQKISLKIFPSEGASLTSEIETWPADPPFCPTS